MKTIKIAHLYPDRMNIYGDNGNIIALVSRMKWRNISCEIEKISIGDTIANDTDIIFIGGGQDKGQVVVAKDLQSKKHQILDLVENNLPVLSICGGYQLFGDYFLSTDYGQLPGINVFDVVTKATDFRMIGNIIVQTEKFGKLVGFENHSGATKLGESATALGRVIKGFGNNPHDKTEGVIYKNAIGTYLHGSLLPKNPELADWLIQTAINRHYKDFNLVELDDSLEREASKVAQSRL